MSTESSVRFRYRIVQIAIAIALVSAVALLYRWQGEQAGHAERLRQLDKLLADVEEQRDQAKDLLARAERTLNAARERQAARAAQPAKPPQP